MKPKEYEISECCNAYTFVKSPSGNGNDPRNQDICNSCGKPCNHIYPVDNFELMENDFFMPCRICAHKDRVQEILLPCNDCIHKLGITNHDVSMDVDTRE